MLTKTQKKVLRQLRAIGGAGWIGSAVGKDGILLGVEEHLENIKSFYGKEEHAKYERAMKKHGVTNKGVHCSYKTFYRLYELGLIKRVRWTESIYKIVEPFPEKRK